MCARTGGCDILGMQQSSVGIYYFYRPFGNFNTNAFTSRLFKADRGYLKRYIVCFIRDNNRFELKQNRYVNRKGDNYSEQMLELYNFI